jgi:hypothetical protein
MEYMHGRERNLSRRKKENENENEWAKRFSTVTDRQRKGF